MPMVINKRLIGAVPESKKFITGKVAGQWVSLAANIWMTGSIAGLMQKLFHGSIKTARVVCGIDKPNASAVQSGLRWKGKPCRIPAQQGWF